MKLRLYNDIDIEGNLENLFGFADDFAQDVKGVLQKLHAARDLQQLPSRPRPETGQRGPAKLAGKRHSIERDRQAVTYHYDVSNDFYSLWLDRRMVYSCAYFETPVTA